MMINRILLSLVCGSTLLSGGITHAAENSQIPQKISLLFPDRSLEINFQTQPDLLIEQPQYFMEIAGNNIPIAVDKQQLIKKSEYVALNTEFKTVIDAEALHSFFVASSVFRDQATNPIEININEKTKAITFDGKPYDGFDVDEKKLLILLNQALETGETNIRVPAKKQFSEVIVHPDLKKRGITEVLAVGKSNFTGSSPGRRQNIRAGARRFNGAIVKKGETFSFNTILDSVDEKYGFVKELVIKGNKNEKELGGGVCQVSTTAFRAAFTGGLPIVERRNHSYSVPYYQPFGIDAMIYLGLSDFKFKNDTPGDLLIQTFIEGDDLYFVYYGTHDDRDINFEGPFISHYQPAPETKVFETTDLPPGETKWVSDSHAGFRSEWIRRVYKDGEKDEYNVVSNYRPWAAQILKGVEKVQAPESESTDPTAEVSKVAVKKES